MKILYVIDGLGTGGAERSLAEMLTGLAELGVDPVVARLYARDAGVEHDVVRRGFRVRPISQRRLVPRVRALRSLLAEERPDLIHTTLFESSLVGRVAALGRPAPVLTSLVGMPYAPARLQDPNVNRLALMAVRMVDTWTSRHLTTHFHAITRAVKRWAVATMRISPNRITVIERGRDPERLGRPGLKRRREARRQLGLREDDEVVLNVGRQEFPKGQRHLLAAVEAMAPHRPRLVVLVAGREGHASPELARLRRRPGVRDVVRFLGHRKDVPEVLAAADLFVFPSVVEGLGGALIEAMALGLPIVSSDLEAIREVVEEGGNALLVPPGSPGPLSVAITSLLDDRSRAAVFGARSRRIFEERFTLARSTQRMVELYRSLLLGRQSGGRTALARS